MTFRAWRVMRNDLIQEDAMHRDVGNQRGFSLVELAIVLVIIGIIIGAIMKGDDLITNARSKKFLTEIRAWEITINTYFDRYGHYPGDNTAGTAGLYNGIIGDTTATDDAQADITAANFSNPPDNIFTLGGNSYYVYLGNDGSTPPKNVIVVCLNAGCTGTMDSTSAVYFSAFSMAIAGQADATGVATKNIVYGIKTTPTFCTSNDTINGGTFTKATNANWSNAANVGTVTALVYTLQ